MRRGWRRCCDLPEARMCSESEDVNNSKPRFTFVDLIIYLFLLQVTLVEGEGNTVLICICDAVYRTVR